MELSHNEPANSTEKRTIQSQSEPVSGSSGVGDSVGNSPKLGARKKPAARTSSGQASGNLSQNRKGQTTLKIFERQPVRICGTPDAPLFVVADACQILGIANHRDAIAKLDDEEKGVASTDTLGGKQELVVVTESGLYALILRCRGAMTPGTKAHSFRKWVTSEVLPAIRKAGSYSLATTDYSLFSLDISNRPVEDRPKLAASLSVHGFLPAHPLHVVEREGKLVVIDGQHRLSEAKKLGIPVHYVVCADAQISIPLINCAQKGWKNADYVSSFSAQGNEHYDALKAFVAKSGFPNAVAAALLAGQTDESNVSKTVKAGAFRVANSELAWRVLAIEQGLSNEVKWSKHSRLLFAIAKCCLVREFQDTRFIQKARSHQYFLVKQPETAGYVRMIEKIYNRQSKDKIPLAHLVDLAMIARGRNTPLPESK